MSKRKKIAVIGIGDFGKVLVKCLHREGHEVLAIDEEEDRIEEIKEFCSDVAIMNSTDEIAMSNMGFGDFDRVILAVANDFEALMVTADILRNTLKLDNITARYQSELQKRLLKTSIGIVDLFNPEETAAMNMAEQFEHNLMRKSMIISDNFRIAEFQIPRSFIGQTLAEIKIKETHNLLLVTIKRFKPTEKSNRVGDVIETEPIGIPDQSIVFREKDVIVVFGAHSDIEEFFENVD